MHCWLCLLLFSFLFNLDTLHAQSPVYETFDVDSMAAPLGGPSMLETFLSVNVQKPFMAQVANVTGKVYVKGVVEPNGRISDVTVMRGLRPDCDQEALRAMRLFNAWKPAVKAGKPVRQTITYPVTFRANAPIRYVNGQLIEYFDKGSKPTNDALTASYQQTTQIDSITGLPSGDLVSYEVRGNGKLREIIRLPFKQTTNLSMRKGEAATYVIGHLLPDGTWHNASYTKDKAGKLVRRGIQGGDIKYDSTGMVYYADNYAGNSSIMQWYGNGLLRQIETLNKLTDRKSGINPYHLISAWDSTGQATIVDGNGTLSHFSRVRSRADTSQKVQFIETGKYADGLKDGVWTGQYSDESYTYSESFDKGKPLGGSATINKTQNLTYGLSEQNPEFEGGQQGMYSFLARNIKYPANAARAQVQGKVYLAFTICTDGTLCDYEVLKGVESSIDAEALRVVRAMDGKWKPGLYRGEPVRVKYNLPISFQFQ